MTYWNLHTIYHQIMRFFLTGWFKKAQSTVSVINWTSNVIQNRQKHFNICTVIAVIRHRSSVHLWLAKYKGVCEILTKCQNLRRNWAISKHILLQEAIKLLKSTSAYVHYSLMTENTYWQNRKKDVTNRPITYSVRYHPYAKLISKCLNKH